MVSPLKYHCLHSTAFNHLIKLKIKIQSKLNLFSEEVIVSKSRASQEMVRLRASQSYLRLI